MSSLPTLSGSGMEWSHYGCAKQTDNDERSRYVIAGEVLKNSLHSHLFSAWFWNKSSSN
jgi:hypothetical protein